MRLSIITPTCDRPAGIALCERYMARQLLQPHEWIVADGGSTPAALTMGQVHLHHPGERGAANLAGNILRALDAVTGDAVVICEDDDWYAPDHLAQCARGLRLESVYGCRTLKYYNLAERCWAKFGNNGAALCQTAFVREEIPRMRAAAQAALDAGDYKIDGRFWKDRIHLSNGPTTVIGIKGLPGSAGLGIGHRPKERPGLWKPDPDMRKLAEWIGGAVESYRNL